jgi:glutaconyl-CoA/methylmalonyl-CoA decarboxylase subunit gamma
MRYQLTIDKKNYDVDINQDKVGALKVTVNNRTYTVTLQTPPAHFGEQTAQTAQSLPVRKAPAPAAASAPAKVSAGSGALTAPIPGLVLEIKVKVGDTVQTGQTVVTMEAMKMENNLTAHMSGTVEKILVQKGSEVATGDELMIITS